MTKEELEKEAEEYGEKDLGGKYLSSVVAKDKLHAYKLGQYDGFIAGAEPREKRIAELEAQIEKKKWHDLQKDPSDLPKDYKTMCICLSDFGSKYEPIPQVCIGYCDSLGWSDYMGSSLYSTVRYWCELPQS